MIACAQTIVIEHECGDLPSCEYLRDDMCDDGGPGAEYCESDGFLEPMLRTPACQKQLVSGHSAAPSHLAGSSFEWFS
jgi:hypothetical protein